MSMMSIRMATPRDRAAIRLVEEHAFGQQAEAGLVDALVQNADVVLELVAVDEGTVVGHILFSRLYVDNAGVRSPAVALAPLVVEPSFQRNGIGGALVREAHHRLKAAGETTFDEEATTCCYAHSDKSWVNDPSGLRWETFYTFGEATSYGEDKSLAAAPTAQACCAPKVEKQPAKACC